MDKKQNLNPELQKIYEKVMNTPVSSSATVSQAPMATNLPPVPQAAVMPPRPVVQTIPAAPAIQSAPASKGFVFTSTAAPPAGQSVPPSVGNQAAAGGAAVAMADPKKGKASGKLLIFGGIAFILFYAVFWLKFFKYF